MANLFTSLYIPFISNTPQAFTSSPLSSSANIVQNINSSNQSTYVKLICKVALRTFIEISISFAYVNVASYFVTTHALPILFIKTGEYLLKSFSARTCGVLFQSLGDSINSNEFNRSKAPIIKQYLSIGLLKSAQICQYVSMMYFLKIDHYTQQNLVHECGHALSAKLLFSQPKIKITLIPYRNGNTETQYYGLNKLGNYFGKDLCKVLVTISGPLLAIFCASVQIMIAQRLKSNSSKQIFEDKEFKKITPGFTGAQSWFDKINQWIPYQEFALGRNSIAVEYLEWSALSSLFLHMRYAFQPLGPSRLSPTHDFAILAAAGIHPVIAMTAIVAIPILAYRISRKS